jgi:hypothetical protein
LLHPRLIGVNGDPRDIHPAALEMDEEQYVVGYQPAQRQLSVPRTISGSNGDAVR